MKEKKNIRIAKEDRSKPPYNEPRLHLPRKADSHSATTPRKFMQRSMGVR